MRRSLVVVAALAVSGCSGKAPGGGAEVDRKAEPEPAAPQVPAEPEVLTPPSQDDGGPKIEFGELVLEGPRDGKPVIAAAYKGLKGLRKCYADRLAKNPELGGGEVSLRFLVATSGSVDDALLHNNKMSDHRVGTCMLTAVKTWKLPPVEHAEPTRVILPMTLSPPS